jgi:hypothetical protein
VPRGSGQPFHDISGADRIRAIEREQPAEARALRADGVEAALHVALDIFEREKRGLPALLHRRDGKRKPHPRLALPRPRRHQRHVAGGEPGIKLRRRRYGRGPCRQQAPAGEALLRGEAVERFVKRDVFPARQKPGVALQAVNGCG